MNVILIVEDEPAVRDMLGKALSKYLLETSVVLADSQAAALRAVEGLDQLQVAILDHNLPDGSGGEVARKIAEKFSAAICVGISDRPDIQPYAHYHFPKPLDIIEVVNEVKRFLSQR